VSSPTKLLPASLATDSWGLCPLSRHRSHAGIQFADLLSLGINNDVHCSWRGEVNTDICTQASWHRVHTWTKFLNGVKVKFVLVLNGLSTTPWRMGEWQYSSSILRLDIRWRWVVSFTPRPLYTMGNRPQHPLNRRLGVPQNRSGHCGEEKHLLSLPGIEPRPSSPQPIAILTALSRFKAV
jgi:hypothetical protein